MSGLRLAELPALFWVLLAGRESRAQLRFILACRRESARVAVKTQVERDVEAGKRAAEDDGAGAFETLLNLRRSRKAAAFSEAGAAQAAGVAAGLVYAGGAMTLVQGCDDDHEVLWVEGRGRVCLSCERRARGRHDRCRCICNDAPGGSPCCSSACIRLEPYESARRQALSPEGYPAAGPYAGLVSMWKQEAAVTISVNGTILQLPPPVGDQT